MKCASAAVEISLKYSTGLESVTGIVQGSGSAIIIIWNNEIRYRN